MNDRAFFFQNDLMLRPADFPDSEIELGVPQELAKVFAKTDVFEVRPIDNPTAPPVKVISVLPGTELPEGWTGTPTRYLLVSFSAAGMGKILRACHIAQWRNESHFCGTCGAVNVDAEDGAQRICPKCGRLEFPRICPAVIVFITDSENRILLAHNKKFISNVYSHISGFNEAGETLEETVVREIREEVKIEVKDIEYIKSQAWPFPFSLMVGYKAKYLSGTIQPDGVEIEDAKWFTKDNLPNLPREGSLSRHLINCWLNDAL